MAATGGLGTTGLLLISACIALGGLAKGLVGLGMPLVALPLLTYFMSVRDAVCVMAIPMLATNVYQMFQGGSVQAMVRRFWPLLLTLGGGIPLGAYFLTSLNTPILRLILGIVVMAFAAIALFDVKILVRAKHEKWIAPTTGLAAGLLGGVAGLWGPPLGVYLVSLKLPKDEFISAIGTAFSIGSVSLLASLTAYGTFGGKQFLYSSASLLPAFAGLLIGEWGRARISQLIFRRAILATLLITGVVLVQRAVLR